MEQDEREMLMDIRDAVIEIIQALKGLMEWLKLTRDIDDTKE